MTTFDASRYNYNSEKDSILMKLSANKSDDETVTELAVGVPRAAAMVDVSTRHLWNEIKAGKLAVVRSGSRTLISIEALRAYVNPPAAELALPSAEREASRRRKAAR